MKKYILSAILLTLVVFTVYKTIPSNPVSSGDPISTTIINLSASSSSPLCKSDAQIKVLTQSVTDASNKIKNISKDAVSQDKIVASYVALIKKYKTGYENAVKAYDAKVLADQKIVQSQLTLIESLNKKIASTTKATTLTSLKKQLTAAEAKLALAQNNSNALANLQRGVDTQKYLFDYNTEELKKAQVARDQYKNGTIKAKLEADLAEAKKQLDKFKAMKDCPKTESATQCTNRIDDDRDGVADCGDTDCALSPACKNKTTGGGTIVVDLPGGCSDGNYTDEASCVANGTWGSDYCSGGSGAGQQDCELSGGSWNQGDFTPNTWRAGKEAPSEIKSTQCMIDRGSPSTYPNTPEGRRAYEEASLNCLGSVDEYPCDEAYLWKDGVQKALNEKKKEAIQKGIYAPDYVGIWAEINRLQGILNKCPGM